MVEQAALIPRKSEKLIFGKIASPWCENSSLVAMMEPVGTFISEFSPLGVYVCHGVMKPWIHVLIMVMCY